LAFGGSGFSVGRERGPGTRRVVCSKKCLHSSEECCSVGGSRLLDGGPKQVNRQDFSVMPEKVTAEGRQPYQPAPPVVGVILAFHKALELQVRHDVADHRLGTVEMITELSDRYGPRERQVLEDRPRGGRKLGALLVAPVEPEVNGGEAAGKGFGDVVGIVGHI